MQLNYTIIEMFGIAGNAYQSELGRERERERGRGRGREREGERESEREREMSDMNMMCTIVVAFANCLEYNFNEN